MTVADPALSVDTYLERLERATDIHDFEMAWIEGLRSVEAPGYRDRILEAAGSQLDIFGETPGDHLRRSWLSQIVEEVRMRGGDSLAAGLRSVVVAELQEAFANARAEFAALRASGAASEPMEDFTLRSPPAAERIRDLGRMAQDLRGSGLMARVPSEDARLARELAAAMAPQSPLVATVPEPWRVSRDRLLTWPEAENELPRLVRSIIAETAPSAEWIDMPAGSGVSQPGWDGFVKCSKGNRFVPAGLSVWELSAQRSGSDAKARADYDKRVKDTADAERADTAYVTVICAPWTRARDFEREKSLNGDFRLVRALNVDSLEAWLECAPRTTVWLREQMGQPPVAGVGLLSAWWARWLESTTVQLDEPVVLAGRDEQTEALRARLLQRGGVITVGGRVHRDEILAFVAAALVEADALSACSADALYVDDRAEAQRLLAGEALSGPEGPGSRAPAMTVVVPSADFADCLPAGSRHRLIVPLPGDSQASVVLEAVDSDLVTQVLQAAGENTHAAYEFGALARMSLLALRRRLAFQPELCRPSWAGGHIDSTVRRSLLLAGWNETHEGDRCIVERFAGCPYDRVTEALHTLDTGDAPMLLTDEQWHLVSPADAWILLSDYLSPEDLVEFGEIAHEVLTEPDPFHGMSASERMQARYEGVEPTFSHQLRRGVATTLALLGSIPSRPRGASVPVENAADGIVYRILQAANDDSSPRLWDAVARELPLLVEAAPSAVLRGLRTCISESHAFATAMFADSDDDDTLFGPASPHLHVIEALETLAWSPDHLNAAVNALASLAAIDPGGTWSNRPSSSLGSIMYGWSPHTSADADARLQAVEMLRERHGLVAWDLMLSMLPEGHGPQMVERGPLYRDWKLERVVTMDEYRSVVDSIGRMLVEDARADSDRWAALVSRIGNLTVDARRALVDALFKIAVSDPGEPFRSAVWPELRETVSAHREHFDADWALPESELEAFDPLLEHLRPAAPAAAYGWLFSSDFVMVDGRRWADDHDAHGEALAAKRTAAIGEILAAGGIDAVLELIETAETSYAVGVALANQRPAPDEDVLEAIPEASEPVTAAALTYFESRFHQCGWELVDRLIADQAPSERIVADLLRAVPAVEAPWRRADALGVRVADEYWTRVSPLELGPPTSSDQLREVSGRLRNAGRVAAAIRLVCVWEHRHDSTPEVAEEVASCLEGWLQQQDPQDPTLVRRDLSRLIGMLDRHREYLGAGRVATLEWQYSPSLAYAGDTGTPNLHRHLAEAPDFFVSLVEIAYSPASSLADGGPEPDEDVRQRALSAHRLLHAWPPGTFSPGGDGQQSVDAGRLDAWVDQVRSRLEESDRRGIGDTLIGAALAASPPDPDGEWPGTAVRDLIERIESDDLDRGLVTTVYNRRGGTTRSPTDGGDQERELAACYRALGRRFSRWPRTAAVFDSLTSIYEDEAAVNDRRAEAHRLGLWC